MHVMPAEIRATVQLYLSGKIREWYARGDGRGAVFHLDTGDIAEMERSLAQINANRMYLHADDPPCQKLPPRSTCSRR